jgi:uncharacterized protein YegP (UPF0339 family)
MGKLELKAADNGKFHFNLIAANGYQSKEAALNGIESVRKNAAGAELVDTTGA